jgi:hypothetical protein
VAGAKKARREGRLIVFIDESGLSERPTRVRTWARRGQTPIIQLHFNWTHISVIARLTRTNCMFRLHEGSIKKEQHVEFLWAWLKRHALANLCPGDLDELNTTARAKLRSAQQRPSIIAACWSQAELW